MMRFKNTAFEESDLDYDGLLNAAEYAVFLKKLQEDSASRGNFEDPRPETPAAQWVIFNQITPGVEGVSMVDYFVGAGTMMNKNVDLRAAAGL